MAARVGITHYAWPGGLAMVIETPAYGAAAVFESGGWHFGHPREVLADGVPKGADVVHLALPDVLADQLPSLQLVGSGLHTDFVHLDRLVTRLENDGTDAALFVLGRAPAALVLSGGQVTVVEPSHEPVDEVLTGADGWIVVGLGKVSLPAPAPPAAGPEPEAAPARPKPEPAPVEAEPTPAGPQPAGVDSAPGRTEIEPARIEPQPAAEPARFSTEAAADGASAPPGAFGRFAADAKFVLAHGALDRLPPEASAQIAEAAGEAGPALMALLDGAHTLSAIAAATGLAPGAVAAVVEILSTHRLVFKYVSRVRPPTGASTTG